MILKLEIKNINSFNDNKKKKAMWRKQSFKKINDDKVKKIDGY